jgi:hypothetical protein
MRWRRKSASTSAILFATDKPIISFYSRGCKRLVVLIYTHSNPENGDLHVDANAAVPVAEVSCGPFTVI